MECNRENLQMYLDGELAAPVKEALETHLGSCRPCRQEMARLQLLWLKLEQIEAVPAPIEMPYLRQQIIRQALGSRPNNTAPINYRGTQKPAWQLALLGASHMPGLNLLSSVSRAAGSRLPKLKSSTLSLACKIIFTTK